MIDPSEGKGISTRIGAVFSSEIPGSRRCSRIRRDGSKGGPIQEEVVGNAAKKAGPEIATLAATSEGKRELASVDNLGYVARSQELFGFYCATTAPRRSQLPTRLPP